MDLQEIKARVETVREAQKTKSTDAKASEIALLWDFVSDIAESSGSYERNKAKFLLCSGIKSLKNGNIDIAAVKNAMQEAFCKLDESSQNGTLEIEKYDGKLVAKEGASSSNWTFAGKKERRDVMLCFHFLNKLRC